METPEVEAVVGRLYLAVVELQKQNKQLVEMLNKVANDSSESHEPFTVVPKDGDE